MPSTKSQKKLNPVFNHLALSVRDLQEVSTFYKDVLLLEPIDEPFKVGRHSWFSLGPGLSLHLIANADETMDHHRSNHMCVSVDSMDDFIEHLNDMDVPFHNSKGSPQVKQIRPDGVQQIFVIDPEGHWVEINDEVGRE